MTDDARAINSWDQVPQWMQRALVRWINGPQARLSTPLRHAFIGAAPSVEKVGEWYVSYRADDGNTRCLHIAL